MEDTIIIQPEEPAGITKRGVVNILFAACCIVAAYLFVSIVPISKAPLGFLVLTASLYAVTAVLACINGGRIKADSVISMLFGLAVASYRFIHGVVTDDYFPVIILSVFSYGYFVLSLYGNSSRSLTGRILLDCVKVISYMFVSFSSLFVSVFKPEGKRKSPKNTLLAILGVFFAAVLVLIVASLLSYDSHFTDLLPKLDIDGVFNVIAKVFFAVPISAMIFGIYASSERRKLKELSSAETVDNISTGARKLPSALIFIPICAVIIVYVLFFISQWAYYMSAFTHTLPEGYSAAEYAREGFFRLCVVVCINTVLLLIASCFNKRSGRAGETLEKVIKILLSVASLILIATAVSKMFLYIDLYDLTRDRLYVTIFLAFLAIAFIAVILSAIIKKLKALPIIIVSGLLIVTSFALINTNALIARYNVDMYLSGKHKNVDIEYLANDLNYSAVPELERLYEEAVEADVKVKAKEELDKKLDKLDAKWYELSIPLMNARDKVK